MNLFRRKKKHKGEQPEGKGVESTSKEPQLDPRALQEFLSMMGAAVAGEAEGEVQKARAAMGKKDWEEAIKHYSEAIKARELSDPAIAESGHAVAGPAPLFYLYGERGTAYTYKGDYKSALADYDKALKLEPSSVQYLDCRGRVYYLLDEYEQAVSDFSQALSLNPASDNAKAQTHTNRAVAYRESRKYELALKDLETAAGLCTDDSLRETIGRLAKEMSAAQGTERLKTCPRCKKEVYLLLYACPSCGNTMFMLSPSDAEYVGRQQEKALKHVDQGSKFFYEERYDDAAREFNMALEINPINATAYANLGVLHLRTGRPHEAVKCFEKALELNPHSKDTQQFLERARREVEKTK